MSVKSDKKRKKIMEAAIKVFAERGFERTRITDVAKRAGTAYGLVYYYFENKEKLLKDILKENWIEFLRIINEVKTGKKGFKKKVEEICSFLVKIYSQFPELLKVVVIEYSRSPRLSDKEIRNYLSEAVDAMGEIVKDAQKKGEIRKNINPFIASIVFFGIIDAIFTIATMSGEKPGEKVEEIAKGVLDIYINGVCR